MAANLVETEAAKATLANNQGPSEETPVENVPVTGDIANNMDIENLDLDIDEDEPLVTGAEAEKQSYANAAKDSWTLELHLYREDNGSDFHISDKELGDLVVKKLGVKKGKCVSADTSPFKKLILEICNSVSSASLNVTQSLQIRKGLYTRPIQAPEKDRGVFIKWASMNFNNDDIQNILGIFGEVTVNVSHVVIQDNGKDE